MRFKTKLLTAFSGLVLSASALATQYPVTITDVSGRDVTFTEKPENIALQSSRVFPLLEIIYQGDAAKHLVAARADMRVSAPSMYENYVKKYPSLKDVPVIGKIKSGEFDVERFINLSPKPDLFLLDLSGVKLAKEKGILEKLESAGINVLVIDFREKPVENTLLSISTFGQAVDREKHSEAYVDYYKSHLETLTKATAHISEDQKKKVFIERAAGYRDTCCRTFSTGNMGAYIPMLNAINTADAHLKGAITGNMAIETVIVDKPDIYIMQTTGWIDKDGNTKNGVPLGYAPDAKKIKEATTHLMDRSWMKAVKAYKEENVYSIYMPFYNSPFNIVAIEYFAKWIHPELFADLDPEATFTEMNKKFGLRDISGKFGMNNFEAMK